MRLKTTASADALPAGLSPELVDVLIAGWGCPVSPEHIDSDAFRIFELGAADLARIYHEHRAFIDAEAGRRGVPVWIDVLAQRRRRGEPQPWAAMELDAAS